MPRLARRDPLLDPTLPPAAWAPARRRMRMRRWLGFFLAILLIGLGAWGALMFLDRTPSLTPDQVAEAAGQALLGAERYSFRAEVTGSSPDGFFPHARLAGEFQAEPLVLHLDGEVGSGQAGTPLAYWLSGEELYVRQGRGGTWVLAPTADVPDVTAFLPEQLAAPFLAGVRRAELLGRERLDGVITAVLALDLDPAVMQVAPPGHDEQVDYRLWVDVWRLRPVRFTIQVERPATGGSSFHYQLDWTYPASDPLSLPDEVRQAAGGGK